jgi:hypothetical protein
MPEPEVRVKNSHSSSQLESISPVVGVSRSRSPKSADAAWPLEAATQGHSGKEQQTDQGEAVEKVCNHA